MEDRDAKTQSVIIFNCLSYDVFQQNTTKSLYTLVLSCRRN